MFSVAVVHVPQARIMSHMKLAYSDEFYRQHHNAVHVNFADVEHEFFTFFAILVFHDGVVAKW